MKTEKRKLIPSPKLAAIPMKVAFWAGFSRDEQWPLQLEMRKAPLMCISSLPCNIAHPSRRQSGQKTEKNWETHKHWSSCSKCHGLVGIPTGSKLVSHVLEWNFPVVVPHSGSCGHQWELNFYDGVYPQRLGCQGTLRDRFVWSLRLTLLSKMGLNPI